MHDSEGFRSHTGIFLFFAEELVDLLSNLTIRDLDVVLGVAIVTHEGKKVVLRNIELDIPLAQPSPLCLSHSKIYVLTSWYSLRLTLGTSIL